jgi:hypothetical protein
MAIDLAPLHATRDRFLAAAAAPIDALARSYAPGKWTGRELLLHITDVEAVMLDRLRRAVAEPQPLLLAIEPDAWAARFQRPDRNFATAVALFAASRAAYIELAGSLTEAECARTAVHSRYGLFTVATLVEKCVWHSDHHLAQVEAIIAGRPWTPATK